MLGSSAPGIITAVVTEGDAKTGPVALVLLSTDGGKTFQQYDPPTLFGDWQTAFTSATTGVIVGTSNNQADAIYYTTNGGTSWHPAQLQGMTQQRLSESTLGTPLVDGSRIYVTASGPGSSGGWLDKLYVSDDGGATFTLQKAVSGPDTLVKGLPVIGVSGTNV